jgi:hypothetical protein
MPSGLPCASSGSTGIDQQEVNGKNKQSKLHKQEAVTVNKKLK